MEIKGGTEERCTGTDGERKRRRRSNCCCCEDKRLFLRANFVLCLTSAQSGPRHKIPQNALPDWLVQLCPSLEACCSVVTTVPPLDYVRTPKSREQADDVVLYPRPQWCDCSPPACKQTARKCAHEHTMKRVCSQLQSSDATLSMKSLCSDAAASSPPSLSSPSSSFHVPHCPLSPPAPSAPSPLFILLLLSAVTPWCHLLLTSPPGTSADPRFPSLFQSLESSLKSTLKHTFTPWLRPERQSRTF